MTKVHADFDHNSPEFRADPVAYYKHLREEGVGKTSRYGGLWLVPTYEAVQAMAHDTANFSPARGTMFPPMTDRPMLPMESDPPLHTEYRKILVGRFSPRAIREWFPAIRQSSRDLLKDLMSSGEPYDLSYGYAKLLPTVVICRMLGLEFKAEFQQWVEDSVYRRISDPQAANEATENIYRMFTELLPERRAHPGDDLVSLVLNARIDGKHLDDEVVVNFCFFLLVAGLDNTNFTIRALLLQLALDQNLQKRLIEDRSLIDPAVEEALRYFSPVIALGRHAVNDIEFQGCPVHQGDPAVMLFGCANRDPREFDEPDEFDIDRFPNRHVAFGVGPHRCLGSNLARAEIGIAIDEVLNAMPGFVLAEKVETRWDDIGPLKIVSSPG